MVSSHLLPWICIAVVLHYSVSNAFAFVTPFGLQGGKVRLSLAMNSVEGSSARIQKIKAITVRKSLLKDITACEFALRVEANHANKDQIIDFDRLVSTLDNDMSLLRRRSYGIDSETLVARMIGLREDMILASQNMPLRNFDLSEPASDHDLPAAALDETKQKQQSSIQDLKDNLRIRIREDGTVDWDGTLASGKEIAKFGAELWERLNGKEEGMPTFADLFGQAQEKVPQSAEVALLAAALESSQIALSETLRRREDMRAAVRAARKNGGAVTKESTHALKLLDVQAQEQSVRRRVLGTTLDLEKICAHLGRELEQAPDVAELRSVVAEVTLLDRQLCSVTADLPLALEGAPPLALLMPDAMEMGSMVPVNSQGIIAGAPELSPWLLVDQDELSIISAAVADLKYRLGLDAPQLLPSFDWGTLGAMVRGGLTKVKNGIAFFKDGTALLFADVQYAWRLFLQAMRGYTLKPREVNALRRTGRDVLTLVPFTIILVIPLTPVGHVLVFSFIQRYFPEFFPSCYSEKRLNLKRLFSEVGRRAEDAELATPEEVRLLRDSGMIAAVRPSTPEARRGEAILHEPAVQSPAITNKAGTGVEASVARILGKLRGD